MADVHELRRRLAEAKDRRHSAKIGEAPRTIEHNNRRTTFNAFEAEDLDRYIGELEEEIAAALGNSSGRRRPFGVIFS